MKKILKNLRKNITFFIIIDLMLWAGLFIGYLKPLREKYPIKIESLTFNEINECELTKKLEQVEKRVFLDDLNISPSIDKYINLDNEVKVVISKENDTRKNEKWATAKIIFNASSDSKEQLDKFLFTIIPQEELEKKDGFYTVDIIGHPIFITVKNELDIQITFSNYSMPYTHNYKEGTTFGSGRAKRNLSKVGTLQNEYFLTIEKISVRKTIFMDVLENLKIMVIIVVVDIIILYRKRKKERK